MCFERGYKETRYLAASGFTGPPLLGSKDQVLDQGVCNDGSQGERRVKGNRWWAPGEGERSTVRLCLMDSSGYLAFPGGDAVNLRMFSICIFSVSRLCVAVHFRSEMRHLITTEGELWTQDRAARVTNPPEFPSFERCLHTLQFLINITGYDHYRYTTEATHLDGGWRGRSRVPLARRHGVALTLRS